MLHYVDIADTLAPSRSGQQRLGGSTRDHGGILSGTPELYLAMSASARAKLDQISGMHTCHSKKKHTLYTVRELLKTSESLRSTTALVR